MISKALRIFREDGPLVLGRRMERYARRRFNGEVGIDLPVAAADVLVANNRVGGANDGDDGSVVSGPLTIDWVIPPIGAGSGGHRTLLRIVQLLADRGHHSRLAVYDGRGIQTSAEAAAIIRRHFSPLDAEILDGMSSIGSGDALVASAWQTAYPVLNAETKARKFYFVQDYEPYFYSMGSEAVLAEDTYRFGLYGITAGPWLAEKLAAEFGMRTSFFNFGSDSSRYTFRNTGRRDKVVFYARPKTPRRGFELGLLALTTFAERHPELEIHLVGEDLSGYSLPDRFVARGILTPAELDLLYNESVAALVISLTNMSLLPLELLSAGCIPVVNRASSNTTVSDNPHIAYSDPAPAALAATLDEVVSRSDREDYARVAAASVACLNWEDAGVRVEAVLRQGLAGQ
ncbi:MAG: hypothetical protein QOH18_1474 [Solirubrobacterales bacterium]|nr:hypothetical protein [Solirubrobacterales bacterium]